MSDNTPHPRPTPGDVRIQVFMDERCRKARHASNDGGARRDRTDDLMLAKHALSQLSYGPEEQQPSQANAALDEVVGLGGLEPPTSRLSSARSNQLSYKPLANSPASVSIHAAQWPGLVHEERETKTAASRLMLTDCEL